MKILYSLFLCGNVFLCCAQTFSPAVFSNGTNSYNYDFVDVPSSSTKETVFTISNVPNGTTFDVSVAEDLDSWYDSQCGTSYGDSNFRITSGKSGIISKGKATFTVLFAPKAYSYMEYDFSWTSGGCKPKTEPNLGGKSATITITINSPAVTSYRLSLDGNSSATVTGLHDDFVLNAKEVLAYPNPANDLLILKHESSVFDTFGNKLFNGSGRFDISYLKSGIYYVKSDNLSQKIVKQ
ncbi:MAG: T9SS type A sorting domain-containing protein [Opitutaceae bacterium]|nr:T9SS type A sorting domain-containing protein [Cytophagales bacterium]